MSNSDTIKNTILATIKKSISVKQALINEPDALDNLEHLARLCITSLRAGEKSFLLVMAGVLLMLSIYQQNLPLVFFLIVHH